MGSIMDSSRSFVKHIKRLIIKVGTAVVTRPNGIIALGRLGSLCEQIEELNSQGYEVIIVTSGAVGLGIERLRYPRFNNTSFVDVQELQVDVDGKACAAVGQTRFMDLYDLMLSKTMISGTKILKMLARRIIPIFNENDAVSTRKAPYEDSSGIFWDNDSLAALLAVELKADLLILLSNVEGLYSGPPKHPISKLIHTYIEEVHQGKITFGDKSRVGRGGMEAKVKAAVNVAFLGIPVVITSGFAAASVTKVLQGERVGTLFHQYANNGVSCIDNTNLVKEVSAHEMAVAARESSRRLQALSSEDRKRILLEVADALEANEKLIIVENEADVAAAEKAGLEKSLISRLALKPGKITSLTNSIRVLANMDDPIGHVLKKTELTDGLLLEKTSSPLGVVLIIFESQPDALVQIASLAIRSGNGLLLKGGKEAKRSNAILHNFITAAIPDNVDERLIGLVTSRELHDVVGVVIPRGSNKLVSQIKESTKIPVLGHSDGICHVYIDKSANMDMAKQVVLDAKIDYPATCNAMETLLVHKDLVHNGGLDELVTDLRTKGVSLYGGPRAMQELNIPEARSFHLEYNSMACTIEIIDDVYAAIDHIHKHGSLHTDCIIAEDHDVAEVFLRQVDSAAVFHNASTRFCDGARFGLGAEIGISTSRIHARGPVGAEGLLTTKWILRGSGQVVGGDKGVIYTHKEASL